MDNYAKAGSEPAFDLAYRDVKAAFLNFRQRQAGRRRGFILAGHSQGSQHLIRLLKEELDTDTEEAAALRSDMVFAYLIGCEVVTTTTMKKKKSLNPFFSPV